MKKCELCNEEFSIHVVIDGKKRNLCNRKYCLNCSPFKYHNTRNLVEFKESGNKDGVCSNCGKEYNYERRKGYRLNTCNSCHTRSRRLIIKKLLLEKIGNLCKRCGYNNPSALCFHHLNPKIKKFGLSKSYIHNKDSVLKEADKCITLCQNCHHEYHNGDWDISEIDVSL